MPKVAESGKPSQRRWIMTTPYVQCEFAGTQQAQHNLNISAHSCAQQESRANIALNAVGQTIPKVAESGKPSKRRWTIHTIHLMRARDDSVSATQPPHVRTLLHSAEVQGKDRCTPGLVFVLRRINEQGS